MKINNIELPESHREALKEAYSKIYSDYLRRYSDLEKEWETLEPILLELGLMNDPNIDFPDDLTEILPPEEYYAHVRNKVSEFKFNNITEVYFPNWPWFKKCEFILRGADRPLTSNMIMDLIIDLFEPTQVKEKLINSVPATLSVAAKEGRIKRRRKDNGEYVYELIK